MKYGRQYLILKRYKQTCVSGVSRSALEQNDWKGMYSSGAGTALPGDKRKRLAREDTGVASGAGASLDEKRSRGRPSQGAGGCSGSDEKRVNGRPLPR